MFLHINTIQMLILITFADCEQNTYELFKFKIVHHHIFAKMVNHRDCVAERRNLVIQPQVKS